MQKHKLVLVSGGLLIVLIAGCVRWNKLPDRRLKQLSHELFQAKLDGDAELIWNAACEELRQLLVKKHGSKNDVFEILKSDRMAYEDVKNWEVGNLIDFDDRATVPIIITFDDDTQDVFYLYLIKADGDWKIHR